MKEGIHPNYRPVVFKDVSGDFAILTKSTINTSETIKEDGNEYPLVKVDILVHLTHSTQGSKRFWIQKKNRKISKRNLVLMQIA